MSIPPYIARLRAHIGTELLLIPSVALIVRASTAPQAKVLLVRSAEAGWWTVPSGMIDPLESPSDAAVRETWEETGLTVALDTLLGVFGGADYVHTYANGDRVNFVTTLYGALPILGTESRASPVPQDSEIAEAAWFTPAAALKLTLKPDARVYLEHALAEPAPTGGGYFPPAGWQPPTITE